MFGSRKVVWLALIIKRYYFRNNILGLFCQSLNPHVFSAKRTLSIFGSHLLNVNLLDCIGQKFCIRNNCLYFRFFPETLDSNFFVMVSIDNILFLCSLESWKFLNMLLATKTCLAEIAKIWLCIWLVLMFHFCFLQNYQLDFSHQGPTGQFHLCRKLLDKYLVENVPCLVILIYRIWEKSVICSGFSCNSFFSETTGWIFCIKVSLHNFIFSEADPKLYFRLCFLFRSSDHSIMPKMLKIMVEMIFVEIVFWNLDLKQSSCFFKLLQKLIIRRCNSAWDLPVLAGRLVYISKEVFFLVGFSCGQF